MSTAPIVLPTISTTASMIYTQTLLRNLTVMVTGSTPGDVHCAGPPGLLALFPHLVVSGKFYLASPSPPYRLKN